MAADTFRSDNPDEWAELALLFEEELTNASTSPTFIAEAAVALLELESGETIEAALETARSTVTDRTQSF